MLQSNSSYDHDYYMHLLEKEHNKLVQADGIQSRIQLVRRAARPSLESRLDHL